MAKTEINDVLDYKEALLYREKISEADMILVGLGEEFDDGMLQECSEYASGVEKLKEMELGTFIPAWGEFCSGIYTGKHGSRADMTVSKRLSMALEKLKMLLDQKNYFVVSVSASNVVSRAAWRDGRLVMPCGAAAKKQCAKGCEAVLEEVTEEERQGLWAEFEKMYAGRQTGGLSCLLGKCPVCGSDMVLNNIYAENYNESGYLEQWQIYMKWLQGTINKKLLILELGVGMRFPTVIRWPFEKAAYFNNKAFFCRVNKKLYQLTEELSGKGEGISQNAIDWLCGL